MTVDMKTSESVQVFQGQFDLTIHAACSPNENKDSVSEDTILDHPVNISFEVKSHSSEVQRRSISMRMIFLSSFKLLTDTN